MEIEKDSVLMSLVKVVRHEIGVECRGYHPSDHNSAYGHPLLENSNPAETVAIYMKYLIISHTVLPMDCIHRMTIETVRCKHKVACENIR